MMTEFGLLLAERERLRRCVDLALAGGVVELAGGYAFSPMAREPEFLERSRAGLELVERSIAGLALHEPAFRAA